MKSIQMWRVTTFQKNLRKKIRHTHFFCHFVAGILFLIKRYDIRHVVVFEEWIRRKKINVITITSSISVYLKRWQNIKLDFIVILSDCWHLKYTQMEMASASLLFSHMMSKLSIISRKSSSNIKCRHLFAGFINNLITHNIYIYINFIHSHAHTHTQR